MNMHKVDAFVRRLEKIGIYVELAGNYPWIYLDMVNGKEVESTYAANHGFTAFFFPMNMDDEITWSNRRVVFKKIREMLKKH